MPSPALTGTRGVFLIILPNHFYPPQPTCLAVESAKSKALSGETGRVLTQR